MINLTDIFYELYEDGYIYEEDENGLNMSYGELAAISDYFWDCVIEELDNYSGFEDKLRAWNEIVSTADDDTFMFWNWDQDQDFYFEVDEDAGTYDCSGTLPMCLKDAWDEWVSETDLSRSEYARGPEFY
jgi:hypothetical protein